MDGPRILIVEDEFLIRLTLAEALGDEQYVVVEAATADEAMRLIEAGERFALLVTDVQVPGALNGLQLAERARQVDPDMPVIFMTGRPDAMRAMAPGRRDVFIAKPYLPSAVCAAARRLLAGETPEAS